MVFDPNQLQGLRNNLRKVSVDSAESSDKTDPKQYGEIPQSVSGVKKMLQEKADGKPGIITPKPGIASKIAAFTKAGASKNNTSTNNNEDTKPKPTLGMKPDAGIQKEQEPAATSAPDVTFLPKPNKEKVSHTNMPLPPVPSVQKPSVPVTKFEPKQAEMDPPDDIYDDACSALKHELDIFDWFHGSADRTTGERSIKSIGKDGTFLVRISEKNPSFPYTLVVLHNGHVNNLRIRKRSDGQFALGEEKADEMAFPNVQTMINHHKSHNVVLLSGGNLSHVTLQSSPQRTT